MNTFTADLLPITGPTFSSKIFSAVAGFSPFTVILCQSNSMSTDHCDEDPPLPGKLLSSALSLLQSQFGMASTPVGGTMLT